MKNAHVLISGLVQGIGFRHFVRSLAQELGLRGWVRNTLDNKVEAFFVGEENKIKKAIEACKKGPFLAEVEDVAVDWATDLIANALEGFEIVE